jgi:hypothetical protein
MILASGCCAVHVGAIDTRPSVAADKQAVAG